MNAYGKHNVTLTVHFIYFVEENSVFLVGEKFSLLKHSENV